MNEQISFFDNEISGLPFTLSGDYYLREFENVRTIEPIPDDQKKIYRQALADITELYGHLMDDVRALEKRRPTLQEALELRWIADDFGEDIGRFYQTALGILNRRDDERD